MKIVFFLLASLLPALPLLSQEEGYIDDFTDLARRKNSVYLEGMGNGGYGSLNYERLFFRVPNRVFALRTGMSVTWNQENINLIVPFEATLIFGNRNCFETGTGITVSPGWKGQQLFFFRAGYRLRTENGILLRVAPLLLYLPGWYFGPFGGLSFGYSF